MRPPLCFLLLHWLLAAAPRGAAAQAPVGVTALSVEQAVSAGIPLAFSPATALAALHARHAATLPPLQSAPPLPRASLQPHLPALRQVAQLCASAAALGARDSAPLWALFLGLAEAQAAAQAARQQQRLPPPPRAWLHCARWAGGGGGGGDGWDAPPALLQPLGRALGVEVSEGAPGVGLWDLGSSGGAVDFLLLDGARSHGALLRDLLALAGRVSKYIGLPHSEYAPHEGGSGSEPPLHTTGIKAALFDFLFLHNGTGAWEVSAHFANHAGFTLLGRRRREGGGGV
jgi:hypothetical protein